ncbi:hypothetical protein PVT67_10095 [Gallaecimonas kandeliae]|uniref:hypothetical protein n=1 Tax=Gallaecimonas kandeliae TaxID=3029055 RepID=UPI002649405F|nr:hypothetical protein [Gallaecimonas kandeliae]WKE64051.1 hypothetical protein PVT67_10095 [Gallaecimonas kandeliae]
MVALASLPVYSTLARMFFGKGLGGLANAIRLFFTPEIISLLRGEYLQDGWESLKFFLFILLCIGWVLSASELLTKALF